MGFVFRRFSFLVRRHFLPPPFQLHPSIPRALSSGNKPPSHTFKYICVHCILKHAPNTKLCAYQKGKSPKTPVRDPGFPYRFETAKKLDHIHAKHKDVIANKKDCCEECGTTTTKKECCHFCVHGQQKVLGCHQDKNSPCHGKPIQEDD